MQPPMAPMAQMRQHRRARVLPFECIAFNCDICVICG
jgi:hypothetical protein